ncbi:MAG TPA: DMT family transporter [Telluria sp.]|jgi:drug/metabolite transporter (DMT)-like permease
MPAARKQLVMRSLPALSDETAGMLLGMIGVAIFGMTFPATRLAVADLPPDFVALGRALVAAMLAAAWLLWKSLPFPPRAALLPLAMVAGGCVIGFPWLTSIALKTVPASHGAVLVGILPLATAAFSALRGNEQPSPRFWLMALAGSALVIGFALHQSGGSFHRADVLMLAAVLLAALGYTEGARLARSMGGQQVISWALVLAAPLLAPVLLWLAYPQIGAIHAARPMAWLGFGYVAVFSMYVGFFFWYGGMVRGGIARVGQVQLVQPFVTLGGAALVLGEQVTVAHVLFALAVIAVVGVGRKMAVRRLGTCGTHA